MCNTCGCNITPGNRPLVMAEKPKNGVTTISVLENLLSKNNNQAEHNRAHFDAAKVLVINLMSSPGSGKTALLEATIKRLRDSFKIAVIEGDLETENDTQRIQAQGVPAYQITTGTACHLDAHLVHNALHHFSLNDLDLLFALPALIWVIIAMWYCYQSPKAMINRQNILLCLGQRT